MQISLFLSNPLSKFPCLPSLPSLFFFQEYQHLLDYILYESLAYLTRFFIDITKSD